MRDEIRREIMSRAAVLLIGGVALLILCLTGCGERALPANVAGAWSYAWRDRADSALHGTMVLAQDGDQAVGTIGFPGDFPSPTPEIVAAWNWPVSGVVDPLR